MVLGLLDNIIQAWSQIPDPGITIGFYAPAPWITVFASALMIFFLVFLFLLRRNPAVRNPEKKPTWDCGYAKPDSRMQYTGTSFTRTIADLFGFLLLPRTQRPKIDGAFPKKSKFQITVPDLVLDRLIMPIANFIEKNLTNIRVFQQGQTHAYILYIVIVAVILLLFGGLRG
jgi:hypothetical protein